MITVCMPVADLLSIVVTAVFVVREVRKLRRMRKAEGNRKPGRLAEAEPAVATLP